MVNEILSMLLAYAAQELWLRAMMRTQVNRHHDHGSIELTQYQQALALLATVLSEACGEDWRPEFEQSRRESEEELFQIIGRDY